MHAISFVHCNIIHMANWIINGLPERFPAVCRRIAPGGGTAYYFAGDFADSQMSDQSMPFAGYVTVKRWTEGSKLAPSGSSFYWRFYVPLMTRLLLDHSR